MDTKYNPKTQFQMQRKASTYLDFANEVFAGEGHQREQAVMQEFSQKLNAYNTTVSYLSGNNSPINDAMVKLMQKQLMDAYAVLSNYTKDKEHHSKNLAFNHTVFKLGKIIAKDYRTLQSFAPDGRTTMPELLKMSKERTIDLSGVNNIHSVGGELNKRMLLKTKDSKNRETKGVFTEQYNMDYFKPYQAAIARWKKNYPQLGEFFQEVDNARQELNKEDPDHHRSEVGFFIEMLVESGEEIRPYPMIEDSYKKMKRKVSPDVLNSWLAEWKAQTALSRGQYLSYEYQNHLQQGDNIDGRNSAMSSVADTLGVGNVIAKSVPMSVKKPDGTVVKGTFMNFADGMDYQHIMSKNENYFKGHQPPEEYPDQFDGKGLKSVSDLFVLDFLCGNTDRNANNMLYHFDNNGKFTGVVGIDNDLSFGSPSEKYLNNSGVSFLGTVKDIKVVSRGMADKIANLTPETLRLAMIGYGLKERDFKSAAERLGMLKKALFSDKENEKCLRVVEDNEWGDIKLNHLLAGSQNRKNIYYSLKSVQSHRNNRYERAPDNVQPNAENVSFSEARIGEVKEDYKALSDKLDKRINELKKVNSGFFISSKQFDNMLHYGEFVRDELKRISARQKPEDMPEAEFRQKNLQRTQEMMGTLHDLCEMYIDHRRADGKLQRDARAQNRNLAALSLNEFAMNNCNKFDLPPDEFYRQANAANRRAAFRQMSARDIGKQIKNVAKEAARNANDVRHESQSQQRLSQYIRQNKQRGGPQM